MKDIILPILLSAAFVAPTIAMDGPPEKTISTHHNQAHPQGYHLVRPGMIVLVNPKQHMNHLTVLGKDDQPVFECDVPFNDIKKIILGRDGTLYVGGENNRGGQGKVGSIVRVKNNKVSELQTYGLKSIINIELSSDDSLYVVGNDEQNKRVIIRLKGDELSPPQTFGLSRVYNAHAYCDGSLYIDGEDEQGRKAIVRIKEGEASQPQVVDLEYQTVGDLVSPDGTLYKVGLDGNHDGFFVYIKDGKVSQPKALGVRDPRYGTVSPDGTLYVVGDGERNKFIVRVKGDEISQPQALGLDRIDRSDHIVYSPADDALYVLGWKYGVGNFIVCVKEDKVPQPQPLGLEKVMNVVYSPTDGTLYLVGHDREFNNCIVRVNDGKVFPPQSLGKGILRHVQYSLAEGALYLVTVDPLIPINIREQIVRRVTGERVDSRASNEWIGSVLSVEGLNPSVIPLLEKASSVFAGGHMNQTAFEQLVKDFLSYNPAILTHEDGQALYHFFMPHIHDIASNKNATFVLHKLLTAYASDEQSPMYGYVLALNFEGSGLQQLMYTADASMDGQKLRDERTKANYTDRLNATKEAKEMLAAIAESTTPDFAAHYVHLLEKVAAALNVLEPRTPAY